MIANTGLKPFFSALTPSRNNNNNTNTPTTNNTLGALALVRGTNTNTNTPTNTNLPTNINVPALLLNLKGVAANNNNPALGKLTKSQEDSLSLLYIFIVLHSFYPHLASQLRDIASPELDLMSPLRTNCIEVK